RAGTLERRTLDAVRHALDTLGPPRVLRTADADGRHRHALGADRPAALGAAATGDAVRMPVAGLLDGLSHVRSSVVGWAFTSPSRPPRPLLHRLGSSSTYSVRPRRSRRHLPRATAGSSAARRSRKRLRSG